MRYSDHLALKEPIGENLVCLSPHSYKGPVVRYLFEFPEEVAIDVFPNRFYRKDFALLRLTLDEFSPQNWTVEARRV